MIKPKDQYAVNFNGTPYEEYNNSIVEDNLDHTGTVVGWFNPSDPTRYSEEQKNKIGNIIPFDICKGKFPYFTGQHIKYLEYIIKEVNTSYLNKPNDLYYIWNIIGWKKFTNYMEKKEDGILDDSTIETLFLECKEMYVISRLKGNIMLSNLELPNNSKRIIVETMDTLTALKRYGIYNLDQVMERTYILI